MKEQLSFDLVIPTLGRPSLLFLVRSLADGTGPLPRRIFVVDDRRAPDVALPLPPLGRLEGALEVVTGRAGGPASARNAGWRRSSSEWVVFLDDDVVPEKAWLERLQEDLLPLPPSVAGSQGRLWVPLDRRRAATDWERNVKRLEGSPWITADMAFRRSALQEIGGFEERFRRAYREDADIGLRMTSVGYEIDWGTRLVAHPVPPVGKWVSVELQAGNAYDVLMTALHGRGWRLEGKRGRLKRHVAITAAGTIGLAAATSGSVPLMSAAAAGWLAGTAELAWARIRPGPRSREEILTMASTSCLLPMAATLHWLSGLVRFAPVALKRLSSLRQRGATARRPPCPLDVPPLGEVPASTRAWVDAVMRPHSSDRLEVGGGVAHSAKHALEQNLLESASQEHTPLTDLASAASFLVRPVDAPDAGS